MKRLILGLMLAAVAWTATDSAEACSRPSGNRQAGPPTVLPYRQPMQRPIFVPPPSTFPYDLYFNPGRATLPPGLFSLPYFSPDEAWRLKNSLWTLPPHVRMPLYGY